ncbi:hypothetical protein VTL71DRAFT_1626 [Oculimacula yallundae]|uniref:ABM domain-containing protein n=1 Tax=Oculimacula yallundae TaxID=86028 RepID=A0ABR4CCF6_9HELO
MYIVSPLSQCASLEKRDKVRSLPTILWQNSNSGPQFLEHIARIAPVTLATEPDCLGYAWFLSAGDNNVVPSHWLRGFEVYESIEANQVAHRASDEYKAFQKAVGEEGLLARPSDLRFWRPAGIGFLTKKDQVVFSDQGGSVGKQYIITDELTPRHGSKGELLDILSGIAEAALNDESALSFWVQDRIGTDTGVLLEGIEDTLYLFLRCRDQASAEVFWGKTVASKLANLEFENRRTTTWIDSGIGFLGR